MTKIETALNVEGRLLIDEDGCYLQVERDGFTRNYKIAHLNLNVRVIDTDASLYNDEILDHNPESMGIVITRKQ